jgi:hypothetical protein
MNAEDLLNACGLRVEKLDDLISGQVGLGCVSELDDEAAERG